MMPVIVGLMVFVLLNSFSQLLITLPPTIMEADTRVSEDYFPFGQAHYPLGDTTWAHLEGKSGAWALGVETTKNKKQKHWLSKDLVFVSNAKPWVG